MDTFLAVYLLCFALGGLVAVCPALGVVPTPWMLVAAALAASLTCFGGAGLLALSYFGLHGRMSLLAATASGLPSSALFTTLAAWAGRTAERRRALVDLTGTLASVSAPIAPGHIGTITTTPYPPRTLAASSSSAQPLWVGTTVVILGPCPKTGGAGVEVAPLALDGE